MGRFKPPRIKKLPKSNIPIHRIPVRPPVNKIKITVSVKEIADILEKKAEQLTVYLLGKGIEIREVEINEKEKAYIEKNPYPSVIWAFCAMGAILKSDDLKGEFDGEGDAMRHCYWGACMALALGKDTAATMLANHEFGKSDNYDAHNNSVAISIGASGVGITDLWGACEQAAKDGKLQFDGSPAAQGTKPQSGKPGTQGKPSSNRDSGGNRADIGDRGIRGGETGGNRGGGKDAGKDSGGKDAGKQGGGRDAGGKDGGKQGGGKDAGGKDGGKDKPGTGGGNQGNGWLA